MKRKVKWIILEVDMVEVIEGEEVLYKVMRKN